MQGSGLLNWIESNDEIEQKNYKDEKNEWEPGEWGNGQGHEKLYNVYNIQTKKTHYVSGLDRTGGWQDQTTK